MHQRHVGVVEILNYSVCSPGNRNQNAQACQNEKNPTGERDTRLGPPVVPGAGGALHAAAGHGAGEPAHEDGQTHEGASRLDVRRQGQQGVVCLTLHVTSGLVDTVHPDAFPLDLRGQNVAADEGRDLPLRQGSDRDRHDPAGHRAGETNQLHASVDHDGNLMLTLDYTDVRLLQSSLGQNQIFFPTLQTSLKVCSLFLKGSANRPTVCPQMSLCQQPFSSFPRQHLLSFHFHLPSIRRDNHKYSPQLSPVISHLPF